MSLVRRLSLIVTLPLLSMACGSDHSPTDGAEFHGDIRVHGDLHVSGKVIQGNVSDHGEDAEPGTDEQDVLAQGPGDAAEPLPAWHYHGDDGPQHWASLDKRYAACSEGRSQSPIDFATMELTQLPALSFSYRAVPLRIENVGHTIAIEATGAGGVMFATKEYPLVRIDFHAPSEHTVQGEAFPFSAHLVHQSSDGEYLIVAIPYELGERNVTLETFWRHLPQTKGARQDLDQVIYNVDTMLPVARSYYMYIGSLTTPPCTEGVRWVFLREPVTVSARQIEQFTEVIHRSARPIQPTNARTVGQGL